MKEVLNSYQNFWTHSGWWVQIIIVIVVTIAIRLLQAIICGRFIKKVKHSRHTWDRAMLEAIGKPLNVIIWLLGLSLIMEIALHHFQTLTLDKYFYPARRITIIVGVIWFSLRFIQQIQIQALRKGNQKEHFDKTRVHAITRIANVIVIAVGALVIMQSLNFEISSILALGGIGGLAITFAAKEALGNFFGGLMIYFDRPFSVGDWIRSPDRDIEGTVEYIGWRSTRVRTFDQRPLYIPNGIFTNITIENPSRMSNRRIKFVLGIRYDDVDKVQAITDDIETMLRAHDDIDTNMALWVNMTDFGPSSIDITVYTFTKTKIWIPFQKIQQDVLLKIHAIVDKHGAECAFPTTTVHVPEPVTLSHDSG